MFIQTENTPNPDAIKFFPGVDVSPNDPIFFSDVTKAKGQSKLAELLFYVNEVKSVFFGSDFITITKNSEANWQVIKPEILMIIMDHFVAGYPVFESSNLSTNQMSATSSLNLSEIEKQIIEIIESRVRPSVAMDGGDIIYKGFENGIVKLQLHGSCAGCPSSTITLKQGIESMLKHFVPEVISVEAAEED